MKSNEEDGGKEGSVAGGGLAQEQEVLHLSAPV